MPLDANGVEVSDEELDDFRSNLLALVMDYVYCSKEAGDVPTATGAASCLAVMIREMILHRPFNESVLLVPEKCKILSLPSTA